MIRPLITVIRLAITRSVIESAINIAYNPCEHSRTKHIDIQYHFLRDHAINGDIVISHVRINVQLADIFTKPLNERRF
jgi:hypothetical protein